MGMLKNLLIDGINNFCWSAAVLALQNADGCRRIVYAGNYTYKNLKAVSEDSLFDLASLSKVLVTTTLIAELLNEQKIALNDKVADFFPEFLLFNSEEAAYRRQITIAHLLAHCSGLPAGFPFYRFSRQKRQDFRNLLFAIKLQYPPGTETIYSDLGFMLLGEIIEHYYNKKLDSLAESLIFKPYKMCNACFNPDYQQRENCIPTELRNDIAIPWQGVVHDENARWLGGVAPQAGLFASANDLCNFAKAYFCRKGIFATKAYNELFSENHFVQDNQRYLGWEKYSQNSSAGKLLSENSFGHTGFTGTSFWIDRKREIAIILLSNAVYPKRTAKTKAFFEYRKFLHEEIIREKLF